jgi:hypothetical protein
MPQDYDKSRLVICQFVAALGVDDDPCLVSELRSGSGVMLPRAIGLQIFFFLFFFKCCLQRGKVEREVLARGWARRCSPLEFWLFSQLPPRGPRRSSHHPPPEKTTEWLAP